jgi:hypothetical protein
MLAKTIAEAEALAALEAAKKPARAGPKIDSISNSPAPEKGAAKPPAGGAKSDKPDKSAKAAKPDAGAKAGASAKSGGKKGSH